MIHGQMLRHFDRYYPFNFARSQQKEHTDNPLSANTGLLKIQQDFGATALPIRPDFNYIELGQRYVRSDRIDFICQRISSANAIVEHYEM
jgi:hypothetical protein